MEIQLIVKTFHHKTTHTRLKQNPNKKKSREEIEIIKVESYYNIYILYNVI